MKQRIVTMYSESLDGITEKMWYNLEEGERISSHSIVTDIRSDRNFYYQAVVIYEQDGGAE